MSTEASILDLPREIYELELIPKMLPLSVICLRMVSKQLAKITTRIPLRPSIVRTLEDLSVEFMEWFLEFFAVLIKKQGRLRSILVDEIGGFGLYRGDIPLYSKIDEKLGPIRLDSPSLLGSLGRSGNLKTLKYFAATNKGRKLDFSSYLTVAFSVAQSGNIETMKWLLENPEADFYCAKSILPTLRSSLLVENAASGDPRRKDSTSPMVKYLVNEQNCSISYKSLETAAQTNCLETVQFFFPNANCPFNASEVFRAAVRGNSLEVMPYLLKNGLLYTTYDVEYVFPTATIETIKCLYAHGLRYDHSRLLVAALRNPDGAVRDFCIHDMGCIIPVNVYFELLSSNWNDDVWTWLDNNGAIIDQTALPANFSWYTLRTVEPLRKLIARGFVLSNAILGNIMWAGTEEILRFILLECLTDLPFSYENLLPHLRNRLPLIQIYADRGYSWTEHDLTLLMEAACTASRYENSRGIAMLKVVFNEKRRISDAILSKIPLDRPGNVIFLNMIKSDPALYVQPASTS